MSKSIREVLALKYTLWYRWHPELALRYLPMVEYIKHRQTYQKRPGLSRKDQAFSVLEVGSGGLGIAPYLKIPVTGVDVKFETPFHPQLIRVIGKAEKLDFADKSFDVVISSDMLEHLPPKKRQEVIYEMIRVAKSGVIVGVPCGAQSSQQDMEFRQEYLKIHKKEFPFLSEQVEYGLPGETDIISYINKSSKKLDKKIQLKVLGNENMRTRKFLMTGWMSQHFFMNIFFRKVLLFLIPLFIWLEKPPYYRQIFFVKIMENGYNG